MARPRHVLDGDCYVGWHFDLLRGDSMKDNIEIALRALNWAMSRSRQREERDYYQHAVRALEVVLTAPSREQLIAEVTVLTEMVRVLSDKMAEMEAEQLELPQPKLTGKFSISAGKFKCTGCTGTWTNREDAKHHSCKEYQ